MIDTHAHLDFESYDNDRAEVIRRFFEAGGKAIINIGVNGERNKKAIDLAQTDKKIFAVIGFHPEETTKVKLSEVVNNLEQFLKQKIKNKIVAIGEIGLDYFYDRKNKKKQKALFQTQLNLAQRYNLPAVIHCRDAYEDVLAILKQAKYQTLPIVMHCYMGNREQTVAFLELSNLKFSLTGNITFNSFEKYQKGKLSEEKAEIFKTLEQIPLEKIMTETDAPFLAPNPYRGKRNESVYIQEIIKRLAEIKKLSFEEVEKITDQNAIDFFGLKLK